ncbi:hypothetical protein CISIN_1g0394372mg, partial [Citrus sinensis]
MSRPKPPLLLSALTARGLGDLGRQLLKAPWLASKRTLGAKLTFFAKKFQRLATSGGQKKLGGYWKDSKARFLRDFGGIGVVEWDSGEIAANDGLRFGSLWCFRL